MPPQRTDLQNAYETTLTATMGPLDLIASVVTKGTLTGMLYLVIEPDSDTQREFILFDGTHGASSFVTTNIINRYKAGSAAPSNLTHPAGSFVRSTAMEFHFDDIWDKLAAFDHGALTGLSDDDHPQYQTVAESDTWFGTKSIAGLGTKDHDLLVGLGDDDHTQYVKKAGDTLTGFLNLHADPTTALKAATKQYVDAFDVSHVAAADPHTGYVLESAIAWTDWTPTYVDLIVGNGTVTAKYTRIGNLVVARYALTFGSTSAVNAPDPQVSAPVNVHLSMIRTGLGTANFYDASATVLFTGGLALVATQDGFYPRVIGTGGTHGALGAVSSAIPFTWTTSDVLSFTAIYEAA